MEKTIRVLYKRAGKTMEIREIPNTLEACQELVGGYIETVPLLPDVLLVCNEEGRIRGKKINPFIDRVFYGDWFICGTRGVEFVSVPRAYIKIVRKFYKIREADDG